MKTNGRKKSLNPRNMTRRTSSKVTERLGRIYAEEQEARSVGMCSPGSACEITVPLFSFSRRLGRPDPEKKEEPEKSVRFRNARKPLQGCVLDGVKEIFVERFFIPCCVKQRSSTVFFSFGSVRLWASVQVQHHQGTIGAAPVDVCRQKRSPKSKVFFFVRLPKRRPQNGCS